ncbi:MAG: methionine--tRNA ligase [Planctomycetota bacterium]
MTKPYYITTALPYLNGPPHIGHAYEFIGADCMARFKRLTGEDVFFLTGSDEHGAKLERAAKKFGKTPKEHADEMCALFKELLAALSISHDGFVRTTDAHHEAASQEIYRAAARAGDIFKGKYSGWYCTPCEGFFDKAELKDGGCPMGHPGVEFVTEDVYFFKMSRHAEALGRHIESHPEFILPAHRANEILNNFIKKGLEDVCVSRATVRWGIPVPDDPAQVIYVWFDALTNYISAIGWPDDIPRFNELWPADLHVVGKDILRFHTTIWPAMLLSAGLPLPKSVYAHGWVITPSGEKMSKSQGMVVDPMELCRKYGADTLRYFLMREVPWGEDGVYSEERLVSRYQTDLANELGNLLHRTLSMTERYFDGKIPAPAAGPNPLREEVAPLLDRYLRDMEAMRFHKALEDVWNFFRRANRYVEETKPWGIAKDAGRRDELGGVLYNLAEALRMGSVFLTPFVPATAAGIRGQLGLAPGAAAPPLREAAAWGRLPAGTTVNKGQPLFPKLDTTETPNTTETRKKNGNTEA